MSKLSILIDCHLTRRTWRLLREDAGPGHECTLTIWRLKKRSFLGFELATSLLQIQLYGLTSKFNSLVSYTLALSLQSGTCMFYTQETMVPLILTTRYTDDPARCMLHLGKAMGNNTLKYTV